MRGERTARPKFGSRSLRDRPRRARLERPTFARLLGPRSDATVRPGRATFVTLVFVVACGSNARPPRGTAVRVSSTDATKTCADLTSLRVCWNADEKTCHGGICTAPLPLPAGPLPSPLG